MRHFNINLIGLHSPDWLCHDQLTDTLERISPRYLIVEVPKLAVETVEDLCRDMLHDRRVPPQYLQQAAEFLRDLALTPQIACALRYARHHGIPVGFAGDIPQAQNIEARAQFAHGPLLTALRRSSTEFEHTRLSLRDKTGYPLSRQVARDRWRRITQAEGGLCYEWRLIREWWRGQRETDTELAELVDDLDDVVALVDYRRLPDSRFGLTLYSKIKHRDVNRIPQI